MNIFDMGVPCIAAITIICLLVAQAVKQTPLANKWLPTICGSLGGILGFFGPYIMSGFPADDPYTAIAVGIVSGLAATGANQVVKQIKAGKMD